MSSPNMTPFCGNKQKVEIQTCAYCASAVHMETQATHSMCSTKQESKIQKGFRDGLSYSTARKIKLRNKGSASGMLRTRSNLFTLSRECAKILI